MIDPEQALVNFIHEHRTEERGPSQQARDDLIVAVDLLESRGEDTSVHRRAQDLVSDYRYKERVQEHGPELIGEVYPSRKGPWSLFEFTPAALAWILAEAPAREHAVDELMAGAPRRSVRGDPWIVVENLVDGHHEMWSVCSPSGSGIPDLDFSGVVKGPLDSPSLVFRADNRTLDVDTWEAMYAPWTQTLRDAGYVPEGGEWVEGPNFDDYEENPRRPGAEKNSLKRKLMR